MKIKEIQYRLDRGYTMAIYGTRENIHEQMNNDIKELLEAINYSRSCETLPSKEVKGFKLNEILDAYKTICKPEANFEKYYSKGFTECWEWLNSLKK